MSYRRVFREWIAPCLLGVGIGLLITTVPTPGTFRTEAAAAREVTPTVDRAAEAAYLAQVAESRRQMEQQLRQLEEYKVEMELLRADLEAIADLVPEEYRMLCIEIARANGLDPRALAALGWVESRWDPTVVGTSGELGITQVMPATGAWIADKLGVTGYDLTDPRTSLEFGAKYLVWLIEETGSLDEALAHYNAGGAWETRAPVAARAYVDRIRTAMNGN